MALFHFHVGQVKRSKGQSAVAAAAYRAGEKLYSEYYGEASDYTQKGGVICSEILLPPQAPAAYKDRETLWNAVEKAERGKKAQLAYSFDIALQNELTMEENIALAREFLTKQFVSRGMVVDYAIHAPDIPARINFSKFDLPCVRAGIYGQKVPDNRDVREYKKDGGIPNPHFHVLCPIRPIGPDGKWGDKQRRVYRLDDAGNPILGKDGKPLFDAVPTTDWGKAETLEEWRATWASMVNAKFEEKELDCRIDHRSYARQGKDQIPTQHEGVAVRQMEARGIITEKGELNRWIKATNATLANLRRKVRDLLASVKAIREELTKPREPTLTELLSGYYHSRNAGAWSQKAKANNLKEFSQVVAMLQAENIATTEDLYSRVSDLDHATSKMNHKLKAMSARMKELDTLIGFAEDYKDKKPIYDHLNGIKFKWLRDRYAAEHDDELRVFYQARRKLKEAVPSGKANTEAWRKERAQLQQDYAAMSADLWARYKQLRDVEIKLKMYLHELERAATHPAQKRETER